MSKLTGIELKRAQLVPSAMFASPEAVVHANGLSVPQKIAILRRWEFDVRRSTSEPEARAVSNELRLLDEVQRALAKFGVVASGQHPRMGPARH